MSHTQCGTGYVIANTTTNTATISCNSDLRWQQEPACTMLCGKPPSVENAVRTVVSTIHQAGDNFLITCKDGYVIDGTKQNQTTLQCGDDGTWGLTPMCIVNCGNPPVVEDATVTPGEVFTPGQTVTYTCNNQYAIPGMNTNISNITCQEDGKWEEAPKCKVECGTPTPISNGNVSTGNSYTLGDKVIYTCDESYVIQGRKLITSASTCQADGTWSVTPSCIRNCGPPPLVSHSIHNGVVITVFVPNDVVTYTCDDNYVIKGTVHNHTTIMCQTSGAWEEAPTCDVNCGPPPVVPHATTMSGDVFTPGQTVTYTCDHQYVISGLKVNTTHVTCMEDGTWEHTSICEVNCGTPGGVSYGSVSTGSIFTPGEEVTYTCDENYVIMGMKLNNLKSKCQANGTWSVFPTCTRNCGSPPTVPHCTHSGVGDVFVNDEQVTYTCDTNYVMKGTLQKQATIKCQAIGLWQNTPICSVDCGTPDVVQHASRTSTGTIFTPGDIVTWTCKDRYVVRETNLQKAQTMCQENGTWTLTPVCVAYCGDHPEVPHAVFNGTGRQEGDRRTLKCVTGHAMIGQPEITCLMSSQWEIPPKCPADCGEAPSLRNGLLLGSGNLENNTRNITCNDEYVLVGAASIKCLPTGQWETLPECIAAAVHAFQQNMFGAGKSPISSQTSIAMIFAILFFICLVAVAVTLIYMLVKKRRVRKGPEEKTRPPSSKDDHMSRNSFDSGHSNTLFNTNTPGADYETPIPRGFHGDRSWRDLLF